MQILTCRDVKMSGNKDSKMSRFEICREIKIDSCNGQELLNSRGLMIQKVVAHFKTYPYLSILAIIMSIFDE